MKPGVDRVIALALALLLGMTSIALAQSQDPDLERAEKLFRQGQRLFSMGRFDGALRSYQEAYDAKPLPEFLFNIAQCHRNLGDYERAIELYRQYLRDKPQAPNREAVETTIAKLEREIEANERLVRDREREDRDRDSKTSPIYKRWQFWAVVAGVTVAGGGATYYFLRDDAPSSDLGNLSFDR